MPNTIYFLVLKGIFDQISIALYFIILATEFERVFGIEAISLSRIIRMNVWNKFKIIVKCRRAIEKQCPLSVIAETQARLSWRNGHKWQYILIFQ